MLAVMWSAPERGKAERKHTTEEERKIKRQRKVSVHPACSLTYCSLAEETVCRTHISIKSPFVKSSSVISLAKNSAIISSHSSQQCSTLQ